MATDDNRALKKAMVALYKLYNNVSVAVDAYVHLLVVSYRRSKGYFCRFRTTAMTYG